MLSVIYDHRAAALRRSKVQLPEKTQALIKMHGFIPLHFALDSSHLANMSKMRDIMFL